MGETLVWRRGVATAVPTFMATERNSIDTHCPLPTVCATSSPPTTYLRLTRTGRSVVVDFGGLCVDLICCGVPIRKGCTAKAASQIVILAILAGCVPSAQHRLWRQEPSDDDGARMRIRWEREPAPSVRAASEAEPYQDLIVRAAAELRGDILGNFYDAVEPDSLAAALDRINEARSEIGLTQRRRSAGCLASDGDPR